MFGVFPCLRGVSCVLLVSMVMVAQATVCVDTSNWCWWWSLMKWCKPHDHYSETRCPLKCDLCPTKPPPTKNPASQVTIAPSVTVTIPNVTPSSTTTPAAPSPKQCKLPMLPFSPDALEDMQIVGNVIRKRTVVSEIQCEDFCLRAHSCLGYNFNKDDYNIMHCELLDHMESYIAKKGFRFRLLDRERALKTILNPKPCSQS